MIGRPAAVAALGMVALAAVAARPADEPAPIPAGAVLLGEDGASAPGG